MLRGGAGGQGGQHGGGHGARHEGGQSTVRFRGGADCAKTPGDLS